MALGQCGECGRDVLHEAASCPHCGAAQPISPLATAPSGDVTRPSSFSKPPPRPPAQEPNTQELESIDAEAPRFAFTGLHGVLALGALLVIAILWYGIGSRSPSERASTPETPAPSPEPQASQAPPAPPVSPAPTRAAPRLSEEERRAAAETLETLKGLQSIAATEPTFREYSPRVLEAKAQVEKYLHSEGGDGEFKRRIYEAMALYLLAGEAWNAKLDNRPRAYESVGRHPALQLCPGIQQVLDLPPPPGVERPPAMNRGINVASHLEVLWSCASKKISEVERTLRALSGGG